VDSCKPSGAAGIVRRRPILPDAPNSSGIPLVSLWRPLLPGFPFAPGSMRPANCARQNPDWQNAAILRSVFYSYEFR
jgi:hypothetical protein